MKKLFFLFILLFAQFSFAQIDKINPKTPPAKDAFFQKENSANAKPAQKVKYIHSDSTLRKPDMYGGNTFFDGNVEFQHNGAVLTANRVIYYDKENFDTKIFSHRQCDDENLICVFFKKYLLL